MLSTQASFRPLLGPQAPVSLSQARLVEAEKDQTWARSPSLNQGCQCAGIPYTPASSGHLLPLFMILSAATLLPPESCIPHIHSRTWSVKPFTDGGVETDSCVFTKLLSTQLPCGDAQVCCGSPSSMPSPLSCFPKSSYLENSQTHPHCI